MIPIYCSEDNEAHREAYQNVIVALKSEEDGIRYQTFLLFNVLMKDKSPIATEGLLKYWESEAWKKLSDRKNTSYHVQDYIDELDINIAAVAALLHHGMELSMYIASSESVLSFDSFTVLFIDLYCPPLFLTPMSFFAILVVHYCPFSKPSPVDVDSRILDHV